jgi:hypothetical protein
MTSIPDDDAVFDDNLAEGFDFQAFDDSRLDPVQRDATERQSGKASFRITVPAPGDPTGSYAGRLRGRRVPVPNQVQRHHLELHHDGRAGIGAVVKAEHSPDCLHGSHNPQQAGRLDRLGGSEHRLRDQRLLPSSTVGAASHRIS